MTTPLPTSDVLSLLRTALRASQKAADAIAIPTLLLPRQWLGGRSGGRDIRIEDAAVYWFRENGFFAERSYKGGQRGYAEVFRVLEYWRPWDPDLIRRDYRDSIADQQAGVARILDLTDEQRLAMSFSERFAEEQLEEKLTLVETLTEEQFEGCYQAIFDSWEDDEDGYVVEDFDVRAGAPDLFVWHPDAASGTWFFCETKAHGDYLGAAQYAWLREWWSHIDGRLLLILVDSDV
jgi:hypothetical protein